MININKNADGEEWILQEKKSQLVDMIATSIF